MCGIFGIAVRMGNGTTRADWDRAVKSLFLLSESRGKEASGIAFATSDRIVVHKDSVAASEMMKSAEYSQAVERGINGFFDRAAKGAKANRIGSLAAIGHCRLVTNGLQGIDNNNQPVWRDNAIVVHNGIVVNVDDLWAQEKDIKPRAEVDTEVIAALVEKHRAGGSSVVAAVRRTFADIYGETSVAMLFRDLNALVLATNTGSLFVCRRRGGQGMFFASEAVICQQLTTGNNSITGFEGSEIQQVRARQGMVVDLDTLEAQAFSLDPELALPNIAPRLGVQRGVEEKAERYRKLRQDMRRCSKCLLPETMPFIQYDEQGVCDYCHSYQPWLLEDEAKLEQAFARRRSTDGKPDCIVAFSGGRDSSYGLHLLKTKFKMTPIAFTYDWGMVTDLARRNQSRICGSLGIEHVWVSADIKKKRDNIRRNILAWLKKPDLGIIPLFMAGDKQLFWHANRIMRETSIPMMVLCTNKYEKTDFKTGFLGIPSRSASIHKPSSLALSGKLRMIANYGKRFLGNPRYLNRSLPDTIGAFLSYYALEQSYLSLFDYTRWNEKMINEALIKEYDWELAKDTKSTWRIGDGTAPFYNYIYYTVAGFTEFDTFRSNQIREGLISREQAVRLVEEENLPRWESIREYTQLIHIDFDETLRVIDRIPKLYAK